MDCCATPSDLGLLLNVGDINTARAQLILELAQQACENKVSPLPSGARFIVLNVAARAYTNPTGVAAQTAGPESVTYASSASRLGIYLTADEIAELRSMAGRGGAFSINTTPDGAGTALFPWDLNLFVPNGDLLEGGDVIDPDEAAMWE